MKLTNIKEANELVGRLRIAVEIERKLKGKDTTISFESMPGVSWMDINTKIMRDAIGLEIADLNARLEKLGVEF